MGGPVGDRAMPSLRKLKSLVWVVAFGVGCGGAATVTDGEGERQVAESEEAERSLEPNIDALWNFGDPAGTEGAFRELIEEHGNEASLEWRLELETQIARTFSLRSEFERAHAVLDEVERELNAEAVPEGIVWVRYRLERGRTFR
ncbi:MAG: hypothetical protein KC561_20440, partial [Myxococcales bacterium]|nr:hypothetical protein [Myxococcales bacterium]